MSKCGKGCMPECEYFTTGGCISPFNCQYKIETGYINSATSIPTYMEKQMSMTAEEIEHCLERFTMGKTTDVMNFDYAGTLAYIQRLEAENAALRERLEKAVELPCKVGDKVYGVGFTDCEDSRTTDEKKKRQIFNVCMKMGGNCEKCKYRRPQIEEFVCTHIQLGDCGIEGKSILIVGDRNENYTANNVFTTSEAAEARLAELKGEEK